MKWILILKTVLLMAGLLLPSVAVCQTPSAGYVPRNINPGPTDRWPGDEVEMRHLETGNAAEVRNACAAFAERPVDEALPHVFSAFNRISEPSVQARCVFTIARIGPPQAEQFLKGLALNREKNSVVRVAAIQGVPLIEGADLHFLIDLVSDPNTMVQTAAARTLSETQTSGADAAIRRMLESKQQETREAAVMAASLWPEAFRKELVSAASASSSGEETRIGALTALDQVTTDPGAKADLQRLALLVTAGHSGHSVFWVRRFWNWITVWRLSMRVRAASSVAVIEPPALLTSAPETIVVTEPGRILMMIGLSAIFLAVVAFFLTHLRSQFEWKRIDGENERGRREALRRYLVEFVALARTLDPDTAIVVRGKKVGERVRVPMHEEHQLGLNRAFSGIAMLLIEQDHKQKDLLSLVGRVRTMLLLATGGSGASAEMPIELEPETIASLLRQIERLAESLLGGR